MENERRLLVLYVSCLVSGLASACSLAVPWLYWSPTLDTCVGENCGCILYSTVTPTNTMMGGAGWRCRYAALVPLPGLLWAAAAALYHAYRVWVPVRLPKSARRHRTVTFNDDGSRRSLVSIRSPPCYSPLTAASAILLLLLFAQAWMVTAGYFATCREYRKSISNQINANGNLAQLVMERLSCGTVLDFLDYIQPDPPTLPEYQRRSYPIHTSSYLQVALLASWICCSLWALTSSYNLYLALHKPDAPPTLCTVRQM